MRMTKMSNKELKNLRTNLNKTQFLENCSRGIRAKTRSKSRNKENSNPDHLDIEGLKISAGESKGETVSKLKLSGRQSYTIVSKASEEEMQMIDKVTFVTWMLDLHNNPNDKKEYKLNFHKKFSHLLEKVERQLQNAIGSFEDIYNDDTTLTKKPTINGAFSLIEK